MAKRGMSPRGFAFQSFLGGTMSPYSGIAQNKAVQVKGVTPNPVNPLNGQSVPGAGGASGQILSPTSPFADPKGGQAGLFDSNGSYYPTSGEISKVDAMAKAAGMIQTSNGSWTWPDGQGPASAGQPVTAQTGLNFSGIAPALDVLYPEANKKKIGTSIFSAK